MPGFSSLVASGQVSMVECVRLCRPRWKSCTVVYVFPLVVRWYAPAPWPAQVVLQDHRISLRRSAPYASGGRKGRHVVQRYQWRANSRAGRASIGP
ncbi:uncharacterized protein SCHCODRAFT_02340995 [Schizophyllum commune H4-8]|uniref:uncharacterized protein n=1 Tax=Schizophyllum commune (strain H4-8 / FGSC 9210) TaxID=578458 RepID=UPI00215FFDCE|nr:uncharacterized protein SCHCODRAFT_02340995 [Schizophyllum commune H4-8]KAI5890278.1 hypothetical protein SCHCODRAFT_02340995 [Schizophyllum commune H4-8]